MEEPMLRAHLTYANIAATLALVIAVAGGTAYAAQKIRTRNLAYHAVTAPKLNYNAVTGSKVRNSSLSGKDLRDNTVASLDVRNGSLRTEDFGAGQLPKGDKGDKGDPATELHGTVSAEGNVVNGSGVTAVSPAGATYTVTFGQDVSKCAVVATVGDSDGGTVTATHAATPQQVTFRTRNLAAAPTQRPFHFAVFC
jgi:hypothetical protein